ncbi:hypothetical protein GIB67_019045 [Kingdonia uniflora]|uniref:ATPase AAA-type core domain-containing protein n=1 Tax=Kingdonia uniflora TaxID=39325 RepID=A0A7J7MZG7_9MAGN|nr:hypothetical protein GIB67_019045 [Kingdonia uniflora]
MSIDGWNYDWEKLHQQLVNVDIINVGTIPAKFYSTIAIVVVWFMRFTLSIGLYLWIDSMARPIYAKLILCNLGIHPAKEYRKRELQEIVKILKNEEEFQNKGIYCPKGLMIHGPPGTGKTLFVKTIAGEAGVPFYAASGTFVEDQMHKQTSKLVEEVGCLQADLEDVGKRHMLIAQTSSSKDILCLEAFPLATSLSNIIEARLIRNID